MATYCYPQHLDTLDMLIIKVGGGADINIPGIVNDLAALDDPFIVVLGANALRDSIGERLATPKQELTSLSGYTSVYSDEQAIALIMMTYARSASVVWMAASFRAKGIAEFGFVRERKQSSSGIFLANPVP